VLFLKYQQVNITFRRPGTRLDHQGIKIEFIGQIGMFWFLSINLSILYASSI